MLLVVRSTEKVQGRGESREGLERTAAVQRVSELWRGYAHCRASSRGRQIFS